MLIGQLLLKNFCYSIIAFTSQVLLVEPLCFFGVEFCTAFGNVLERKFMNQFVQGKNFLCLSGMPSQERQYIYNSIGKITALAVAG